MNTIPIIAASLGGYLIYRMLTESLGRPAPAERPRILTDSPYSTEPVNQDQIDILKFPTEKGKPHRKIYLREGGELNTWWIDFGTGSYHRIDGETLEEIMIHSKNFELVRE